MHNDRINSVHKLMHKYQHVNKYLGQINPNEQQAAKNLEGREEQQKKEVAQKQKEEPDNSGGKDQQATDRSSNMRWKQKFLKLQIAGDKFDK